MIHGEPNHVARHHSCPSKYLNGSMPFCIPMCGDAAFLLCRLRSLPYLPEESLCAQLIRIIIGFMKLEFLSVAHGNDTIPACNSIRMPKICPGQFPVGQPDESTTRYTFALRRFMRCFPKTYQSNHTEIPSWPPVETRGQQIECLMLPQTLIHS